jgi:hypothetical protein
VKLNIRKPSQSDIAQLSAAAVAAGTAYGSCAELIHMGTEAGLTAPWALPLAIDVTALVAALSIRAGKAEQARTGVKGKLAHKLLAWAVLVGLTLLSAAVQVIETGSPLAAILPFGAFVSFELAMSLGEARAEMRTEVAALAAEAEATEKAERKLSRGEQLRAEAKELGIEGRSKMNVEQLEKAIKKARRPRAVETLAS